MTASFHEPHDMTDDFQDLDSQLIFDDSNLPTCAQSLQILPLVEQVRGQTPLQLPQDVVNHNQPIFTNFSAPLRQSHYQNPFLAPLDHSQLSRHFRPQYSLSEQNPATHAAHPTNVSSYQPVPHHNVSHEPPKRLAQRRGIMLLPIIVSTQVKKSVTETTFPRLPLLATLKRRVLVNIVDRLDVHISKDALTPSLASHIFEQFATPEERFVVARTVIEAQAESHIDVDAEQSHRPSDVQHPLPSQPQPNVQSAQLTNHGRSAEESFRETDRALLSPRRLPDGTVSDIPDESSEVFQPVTKQDRPFLRTSCYPCYERKQPCDKKNSADGVCSACKKKKKTWDPKGLAFDPELCCKVEYTEAFAKFKAEQSELFGRAKRVDEGWKAKRNKAQAKRAKDKHDRNARKRQRGGEQ